MTKTFKRLFVLVFSSVVGLFLTGCGSTEVDLNDYLNIEFSGFDGFGTAVVTVDLEQLAEEHADNISDDDKPGGLTNEEYIHASLLSNVELSVDESRQLTNGDEMAVSWVVRNQEDLEESLDVTFTYEDVTIEVDDLVAVETFDAFENVDVVFSGFAPSGMASVNVSDSLIPAHSYTMDTMSDLANGDAIMVTIDETVITELAISEGVVPAETERQYIVDGLAEYVTRLSEITDEAFEDMNRQGQDAITAYVAQEWDDVDTYDSATPLGYYLLTPKNADSVSQQNRVILAYQINTTENFAFNSYIEFYDLLKLEDGSVTFDIGNYSTPRGSERFRHNDLTYLGYESLGQLFNTKVAQYVDQYNYETNID